MSDQFYIQHSRISDPGEFAHLYADLPADVASICHIVQGMLFHYFDDVRQHGIPVPPERLPEIDTRYAEAMLRRILELDSRPLAEARPPEKRLIGCCRDFTLMAVSIARSKGIPARSRYGFATYFEPGYYWDHVVMEYWNGSRWVLADPQMTAKHIRTIPLHFDVLDVPRDQFVVAGQGWQICRAGQADPQKFGLGSNPPPGVNGMSFIQSSVVRDLAALNKVEMLCWEGWGLGEQPNLDQSALSLLDQAADLGVKGTFDEISALYEHNPQLTVPPCVLSFSPALPAIPFELTW